MSNDAKSNFFSASVISTVEKCHSRTIRRRAERGNWPRLQRGNRFLFSPPRNLLRKCAAMSPVSPIWEQPRLQRELLRAAAILGFCRRLQKNPKQGIERALRETVSDFRHLLKFSPHSLRNWIRAVEQTGLGALRENKVGRVGAKPARLEKVLR